MTKPNLVLIPGLGSDAAVWRRTMLALDGEICGIVGDTLSDGTLRGMARRILGHAPESFALAGVSMGGMVALELMKLAPERVTHLALVDTNARADTFGRKTFRHIANLVVGMTSDFKHQAERSVGALVHPSTPRDVTAELVEMSVRVGAKTYIRQNRAVSVRTDLRHVLPTIAVPTSVIVGQEDRITPVAFSEEIHSLIAGSTLDIVLNCGHLPPIEKPERMAALLKTLIRRG